MAYEMAASVKETAPWDEMVKEAALGGVRRARKWFVGVRQRPSGRWVAEIKDAIQKIRVWLGSYNTAEEAARAYDEAACLLCGANTRTNFWASPGSGSGASSSPALPAKITNLLLQRLRAQNSGSSRSNHPPSLSNLDFDEQPMHLVQEQVAEFTQMQFTDFLNFPEEDSSHNNSDNNASGSIVTDDNYQSGRHELGALDYQPLSRDCSLGLKKVRRRRGSISERLISSSLTSLGNPVIVITHHSRLPRRYWWRTRWGWRRTGSWTSPPSH